MLDIGATATRQTIEADAQGLVDRLPSLLLEARRVAAAVAQGIHGRRRAGQGETFWQFRSFEQGDSATSVDWRRSASSSHLYVREREWEAAHTVWVWPDLSKSMHFRSHLANTTKAERAVVLSLALSSLLSDGGERVGIPGFLEPRTRRNVSSPFLSAVAKNAARMTELPDTAGRMSRHSEIVIVSDFLDDASKTEAAVRHLARQGLRGHLVQILDPAEETLPYTGRIEFRDDETGVRYVAERAETLRDAYRRKLDAHKARLGQMARQLGWSSHLHHTDRPAVEVLLRLHMHMSGMDRRTAPFG
jgi:uncharacterized protein (DUF58 family)